MKQRGAHVGHQLSLTILRDKSTKIHMEIVRTMLTNTGIETVVFITPHRYASLAI
jgi:hypothetical protein